MLLSWSFLVLPVNSLGLFCEDRKGKKTTTTLSQKKQLQSCQLLNGGSDSSTSHQSSEGPASSMPPNPASSTLHCWTTSGQCHPLESSGWSRLVQGGGAAFQEEGGSRSGGTVPLEMLFYAFMVDDGRHLQVTQSDPWWLMLCIDCVFISCCVC